MAGVADPQPHELAGPRLQMQPDIIVIEGDVGRLQVQGPALRHGVAGVQAQVHQHLVDLALVGLNVPQRPRSLNFHRDARSMVRRRMPMIS